jgi:hypothetical protein
LLKFLQRPVVLNWILARFIMSSFPEIRQKNRMLKNPHRPTFPFVVANRAVIVWTVFPELPAIVVRLVEWEGEMKSFQFDKGMK